MSKIDVIEAQIEELWDEREKEKARMDVEAERLAEAEREKAEAMKALPGLREREAELRARHDAAIDELDAVIDEVRALRTELGKAHGKPRFRVHNSLRVAVVAELQRRKMRERLGVRDRDADKKRQIQHLKETLKVQKAARKGMVGGGGSKEEADQRIAETEALIRRLEGKGRVVQEDEEGLTIAGLAKQRVIFGKKKEG